MSLADKVLFKERGETGDRLESDLFNPDGDGDSGTPTPVCHDEAEEVADLATELGNLMEAEGFVHRQEPLPLQDGVDLPVPES